jgi:3-dehydroquinate synthase
MSTQTITITLPPISATTYDIRIGAGLLSDLGTAVRAVVPAPTAAVISDDHVSIHYLARATASLQAAGYRVISHVIPAGEKFKTFRTYSEVLDSLLNAKIERATPVIALGGGVVGDLSGFVAASILRGIPFVQVPTTLLAAVDSSIGGKTGIDHPAGKNLVGAFHQPRLVLTDTSTFKTLPVREIRCGLAECIKHAVIRDASLLDFIADNAQALLAAEPGAMIPLVTRNVAIKAAIVTHDPFEKSVRALLNFGHTFGHAIENVLEYSAIQHGEGVALGMVAAGRMAAALDLFPPADLDRMIAVIRAVGLPTALPDLNPDQTFAAMFTDKKVRAGKLRFILPTRLGDAQIFNDIPEAAVKKALGSLVTRGNPPA